MANSADADQLAFLFQDIIMPANVPRGRGILILVHISLALVMASSSASQRAIFLSAQHRVNQ